MSLSKKSQQGIYDVCPNCHTGKPIKREIINEARDYVFIELNCSNKCGYHVDSGSLTGPNVEGYLVFDWNGEKNFTKEDTSRVTDIRWKQQCSIIEKMLMLNKNYNRKNAYVK